MFLDPRLVELAARYSNARKLYAESIKELAHPRTWDDLSPKMKQEWYITHVPN